MKNTLNDRIKDFSKIKLKKAVIKVPRLKIKKQKIAKPKNNEKIPLSSLINILIKSAVEKAKSEKKEKAEAKEDKSYTGLKEDKIIRIGGYGTTSKTYGVTLQNSYLDYAKLFSYLGKFKTKSPYENLNDSQDVLAKATEDQGFLLIEKETIERGARYVKYFMPKATELNTLSLVPLAGMSSSEWEQFKLWMKLDPVMYRLKTSTP